MARNLLTKKSIKFGGESREKVMRVPFGLGAPADAGPESTKAAEKCLRCGFGNVPVVEKRRCESERKAPSVGAGPFKERAVERDGRRGETEGLRAFRGDQRERHLAR